MNQPKTSWFKLVQHASSWSVSQRIPLNIAFEAAAKTKTEENDDGRCHIQVVLPLDHFSTGAERKLTWLPFKKKSFVPLVRAFNYVALIRKGIDFSDNVRGIVQFKQYPIPLLKHNTENAFGWITWDPEHNCRMIHKFTPDQLEFLHRPMTSKREYVFTGQLT